MEKRNYIAFISYRHSERDSVVAKALHTLIERYRIPKGICNDNKKRLGVVFRDKEELSLSSDLSEEIHFALDHSEYLIVVCSKKTRESHWVYQEIDYFLSHHDRTKVFAVVVDGDSQEVIPPSLIGTVNYEDGTVTSSGPLAANVCSNSTLGMYRKLHIEKLRLFSAMLGCPFDKLFMREHRRQRRQVIGITSLILTIALAFSTMLLVKNYEINQKNQELAQQKEEVLVRESKLLVHAAEEALAEGDSLSAIRNAVAALPSSGNDRPYYAPAEQVLISALGFFDSKSAYFITDTILEQNTPISDFAISEDGSYLATVDPYGVITCYDTNNGTTVWSAQQGTSYPDDDAQIFPVYSQNSIVVFCNRTVAYSIQTGDVLWSCDGAPSVVQSEDQRMFMYLGTELSEDDSFYLYHLICLSADNGEILYSAPLTYGSMLGTQGNLPCISFPYYGTFSADGKLFAGCYREDHVSDTCTLHYYIFDLESGAIKSVYSTTVTRYSSESFVYKLFFCDGSKSLAIIRGNTTGYVLEKIDLQRGELLWASQLSEDNLYGTTVWHCAQNSKRIFVGCKNWLYVINISTGEQVASIEFEQEISLLETLGKSYYQVILVDGTYGVGIGGLIYHQATVLGNNQYIKLWENGVFQAVEEDNFLKGFETSSAGYVAMIPPENNHCVKIKRVLFHDSSIQETAIDIPLEDSGNDLRVWHYGTDAVVVGQFYNDSSHQFEVIDLVACQWKETILCPKDYIDTDEVWFLSNGAKFIECDECGNITLYNAQTGNAEILAKEEKFQLYCYGDLEYWPSKAKSKSVPLSDGRILTVWCNGNHLHAWLDGLKQASISLPDNMAWFMQNGDSANCFLDVGSNGYALLSNFTDDSDLRIDELVAYDIFSGIWYPVSLELVDLSRGFTCFATQHPILGIGDNKDQLFIFDIPTGELINQFPLHVPVNAVEEMEFVLEDTFIILRTNDLQLLVYDVVTGEIVLREQLQDSFDNSMEVSVDSINQRIYIVFGNAGICLDISSWTKLADIPEMLFYDSQNNQIYRYDHLGYDIKKRILVSSLPSTSELTDIARRYLD